MTHARKGFISMGIAMAIVAGIAHADTISQTNYFGGTPNYSSDLVFNQFDDQGGTRVLDSVLISVQLDTAAGAALRIDNDAASQTDGTAGFGSAGIISASDVTLAKQGGGSFNGGLSAYTSANLSLSADDGDIEVGGTPNFSTSGFDYDFLTTAAVSTNDSAYINSFFFNEYTGTGNYTITYAVSQYLNTSAFGGAQIQLDPTTAGGNMTVDYTYHVIPEPSTLTLVCGLSGFAVFIRRRFMM